MTETAGLGAVPGNAPCVTLDRKAYVPALFATYDTEVAVVVGSEVQLLLPGTLTCGAYLYPVGAARDATLTVKVVPTDPLVGETLTRTFTFPLML